MIWSNTSGAFKTPEALIKSLKQSFRHQGGFKNHDRKNTTNK